MKGASCTVGDEYIAENTPWKLWHHHRRVYVSRWEICQIGFTV